TGPARVPPAPRAARARPVTGGSSPAARGRGQPRAWPGGRCPPCSPRPAARLRARSHGPPGARGGGRTARKENGSARTRRRRAAAALEAAPPREGPPCRGLPPRRRHREPSPRRPRVRSWGPRAPDVEEIEPLRRVLPDGLLEDRHPAARGVLRPAPRDLQGLCHLDEIAMLGVEEAEGGHHRHSHGPGKEKRPEGKRSGRPEEGNEHVPPRA